MHVRSNSEADVRGFGHDVIEFGIYYCPKTVRWTCKACQARTRECLETFIHPISHPICLCLFLNFHKLHAGIGASGWRGSVLIRHCYKSRVLKRSCIPYRSASMWTKVVSIRFLIFDTLQYIRYRNSHQVFGRTGHYLHKIELKALALCQPWATDSDRRSKAHSPSGFSSAHPTT